MTPPLNEDKTPGEKHEYQSIFLIIQQIAGSFDSIKDPAHSIEELADLLKELEGQEEKAIVLKLIKQKANQIELIVDDVRRHIG